MIITIEGELRLLGFVKGKENKYGVKYRRKEKDKDFTHVVCIDNRQNEGCFIYSFEEGTNSDGFNNAIGLTERELEAFLKKFKQIKRKYRWR